MNHEVDNGSLARSVGLRPAGPEDERFLLEVYASTRADEMALVPWNEEQKQAFVHMQFNAQQRHYRESFPGGRHQIVLSSGRPVGRLYTAEMDQETRILDITILPSDRNAGIGSYLLKQLVEEAARVSNSLSIFVEIFNPSLRLFERLGFLRAETEGIHVLMKYHPRDSASDRPENIPLPHR